jgi:hypothetical protein
MEVVALTVVQLIAFRYTIVSTILFQRPVILEGPGIIKINTWSLFAWIAIRPDINISKYLFLMFNLKI